MRGSFRSYNIVSNVRIINKTKFLYSKNHLQRENCLLPDSHVSYYILLRIYNARILRFLSTQNKTKICFVALCIAWVYLFFFSLLFVLFCASSDVTDMVFVIFLFYM
jgi:hypothetical protein